MAETESAVSVGSLIPTSFVHRLSFIFKLLSEIRTRRLQVVILREREREILVQGELHSLQPLEILSFF